MDVQNGIDKESSSDTDERNENKQQVEIDASGNTDTFNLADPDALLKQLERVELTDEDTEELLNEAYKVNLKLRNILQKQVNDPKSRMTSAKAAYGHASVNQKKRSPSADQKRRRGSSQTSLKGDDNNGKSKRGAATKSGKDKPTWDDRFSYT